MAGASRSRARGKHLIATALALSVAVACAAIPSSDATSSSAKARARCPELSFSQTSFSADAALVAAKRLIRNEYRQPPEKFNIALLARLDTAFRDLPGLERWRALATRQCGRQVANYSWVVGVHFPYLPITLPTSISFITNTRAGWRLWYRHR